MSAPMLWIFGFTIALLLVALVWFFIAHYRFVEVDLSLFGWIRLRLSGKK
jgi:hypothetical protein